MPHGSWISSQKLLRGAVFVFTCVHSMILMKFIFVCHATTKAKESVSGETRERERERAHAYDLMHDARKVNKWLNDYNLPLFFIIKKIILINCLQKICLAFGFQMLLFLHFHIHIFLAAHIQLTGFWSF